VARFDHADALGGQAVRVARDGEPRERRVARPVALDRKRHRGRRLAGRGDEGAPARRARQVRGQNLERIRRGHCRAEAFLEQGAHRLQFTGARGAWEPSHRQLRRAPRADCAILAFL
jgi:hypothetical protein